MPKDKMEKPALKILTVKLEPDCDGESIKRCDSRNRKDPTPIKFVKFISAKPKEAISPPSYTGKTSEFKQIDDPIKLGHIIGRGIINKKEYYLYFLEGQKMKEAKWYKGEVFGVGAKVNFMKNKPFEARLRAHTQMLLNKEHPFLDIEFIQKRLKEKQMKKYASVKRNFKLQELKSKFYEDFLLLKTKVDSIEEINRFQFKQNTKNVSYEQGEISIDNSKKRPETVVKIKNQFQQTSCNDSETNQLPRPSNLTTKLGRIEVKNSKKHQNQNQPSQSSNLIQKNQQNFENAVSKLLQKNPFSTQRSFESSDDHQSSLKINGKTDFSKEEIRDVKYAGRIKEKDGNYENLYRFSLVFHPDIFSTMKIIREDEFLRDGFMKFAEQLYEQYRK